MYRLNQSFLAHSNIKHNCFNTPNVSVKYIDEPDYTEPEASFNTPNVSVKFPHPKEITLRVYYVSILQMYRLNRVLEKFEKKGSRVSILQMYRLN